MNAPVRFWRRPIARTVLLSAAIVAAPLPCLAGDASTTAPRPSPAIKATVAKILVTQRLAASMPVARAQNQGTTNLGSSSFFKTKAGIITIVAMVAGVSYALYSTSHDRVSSPNRQYGGSQ
ncbi:MAG: hypothetical protein ACM36C_03640 [Acidobacteriota bacterium]